jgi:hypothetical protein
MGKRGDQREKALKAFLEKYLPKKFSLGTGNIIDSKGNISRQCDIVIYDSLNCPILYTENEYQLFPAEAVYAVIEVKSVLSALEIDNCIENIRSVKSLIRDKPISCFVFSYRSSYKTNPKAKNASPIKLFIDSYPIMRVGSLLSKKTE